MKRSRIFLGATTALLAVAGIAAAKVHSFGATITRYYCTGTPLLSTDKFKCITFVGANATLNLNGSSTYKISYKNGNYTLYTNQAVQTTTRFCTIGTTATACQQPLKYVTND